MAKTLEKARKHIAKKRGGNEVNALHQYSRDSKRLQRAQIRDERLEKLASLRHKKDKPLLERAQFFQVVARENENKPLNLELIQSKIQDYINQYREEYDTENKARRPGRPANAREDLLKTKVASLETEYQKGFYIPDLSAQDNLAMLDRWEGSWSYLTSVRWVRITADGDVRPSSFPPKN